MSARFALTICADGTYPYLCCLPPGHTGWHQDPGLNAAWRAQQAPGVSGPVLEHPTDPLNPRADLVPAGGWDGAR